MRNSILYIMLIICLSVITPLDLFSQQSEENGALSDPFSNSTLFGDKDKSGDKTSEENRDEIFYDTSNVFSNAPMFFNYQSLNDAAGSTISGDPGGNVDTPFDDWVIYLVIVSVIIVFRSNCKNGFFRFMYILKYKIL